MGTGVAAQHQPLILGATWLGFPSAFLSRATCLNISSPLLLGDQVLGPSTSWNHPFALGNTWFPQNLGPKFDHERTKRLEISNQVVLWGEERDFEVPISLGNHPFALANTQFPKNWGPKLGCPRNMGNSNIQPSRPKEKGIWKFQPRCPNKGSPCLKETWFFPGGQGVRMPWETWLGRWRGVSDNPQPRFHLDLLSLGKLQLRRQLAYRNCIGITFSFVICVVPLKEK